MHRLKNPCPNKSRYEQYQQSKRNLRLSLGATCFTLFSVVFFTLISEK